MTEERATDEIAAIVRYVEGKIQAFIDSHPFTMQKTILQELFDHEGVRRAIVVTATRSHIACYQYSNESDAQRLIIFIQEKIYTEMAVRLMIDVEAFMRDVLPKSEMGSRNKYKKLEGADLERIEKLVSPNEKQQLEALKELVRELFDEASWDVFDSIQNTACKLGIFRQTSEGYELADWLKGEEGL